MTVTVTTAVAALRSRLNEPTAGQWSDVELRRWLDEGIRDIARRTRLYEDQVTVSVTANVGEYTLPSTVLAIRHLLWKATADTRKYTLEARAFGVAINLVNETSPDPYIYTTWGRPPVLKVQLYPTPSRVGTLYLYGSVLPAAVDVTNGTGNIDVIEGWLEVAYDYAEYMARRKDKDDASFQSAFQLYEAKIAAMIDQASTDDAPDEFQFTGTSILPSWLTSWD